MAILGKTTIKEAVREECLQERILIAICCTLVEAVCKGFVVRRIRRRLTIVNCNIGTYVFREYTDGYHQSQNGRLHKQE